MTFDFDDFLNIKIQPPKILVPNGILNKKNIVFTGGLVGIKRQDAINMAQKLGAKVQKTVTASTDYVVCPEDAKSSVKMKKAVSIGTKILTEEDFADILRSNKLII